MTAEDDRPVAASFDTDILPKICMGCGCLCHDLKWPSDTEAGDFQNCVVAERWFEAVRADGRPIVDHQLAEAAMAKAVEKCVEAAIQGRRIAVIGLEHVDQHSQKAAIELAEAMAAWIASTRDTIHLADPCAMTFAQKGSRQSTWGEIRLRADSLLYWYAPLWETHPRWSERFAPKNGQTHRLAVVSDGQAALPAGWIDDQSVRVDPANAVDFVRAVRLALREDQEPTDTGVRKVVHLFRNAHWLALVRSEDPPGMVDPFGVAESVADLVAEADGPMRRVVVAEVPAAINSAGAAASLSMRTGLATPLRFTSEGPVYAASEFRIDEMEFVVSLDPQMPPPADRPGVWFDQGFENGSSGQPIAGSHTTVVHVARFGYDAGGMTVRGDGVAIPVPAWNEGRLPAICDTLASLAEAVRTRTLLRSVRPITTEPRLAQEPTR